MPRYKHGKQEQLMEPQVFRNLTEKARLTNEKEAYLWMIYHAGIRKSEGYERTAEDVQLTPEFLIIDIPRKKNSAQVPPLKFCRSSPGVEAIVKQYQKALERKPTRKTIYYQEETEEPILKNGQPAIRKNGKPRMKKRTAHKKVKARWLFPFIGKQTAWRLVKTVLGEQFYPHFLRLNALTEIAEDPTSNLTRLKSQSGIKTIKVLEAYMGVSEKEQDQAREWREKKWSQASS